MSVVVDAVKRFGKESQCRMAIEEMSELTKEICKNLRGEENVYHIAEEIADVEIMLKQLKLIFDCSEIVKEMKNYKIERLQRLIELIERGEAE